MKNKKVILSCVFSLVLCLSMIVGGTFALFTSDAPTNIAVTSGTVKVVATIDTDKIDVYSPTSINEDGSIADKTNAANDLTFKNGGTVSYDGSQLTLTNITPGDKVDFNIDVANESNVEIQYRVVISATDNLNGLNMTINGETYTGDKVETDWTLLAIDADIASIPVSIELPTTAGNDYQNKTTKLTITVKAVQGNTNTISGVIVDKGIINVPAGETLIIGGGDVNDYKLLEFTGEAVVINDVTFSGTAIVWGGGGLVTINGGTFTVTAICIGDAAPAPIVINGGYFDADSIDASTGVNVTINGGTFTCDPSGFVADGHTATNNGDGTWTVQ